MYMTRTKWQNMSNWNHVVSEKIIQFNLERISLTKQFTKSKSEDMQSVAKHPAYHHHNDVNRGDYHT